MDGYIEPLPVEIPIEGVGGLEYDADLLESYSSDSYPLENALPYPIDETYGEDGPVYDGEEGSDVYISDEVWDEDEEEEEDAWVEDGPWLPVPSPPANPAPSASGAQQQVVIAGGMGGGAPWYPEVLEVTQSYCNLYPAECAGKRGLQPRTLNSTCTVNCTDVDVENSTKTALGKVDLSGFGLAVLIGFLILVGIHFGWEKAGDGKASGESFQ